MAEVPVKSRLRWRGQQTIDLHDETGKRCSLVAQDLIEGRCTKCGGRFWVTSRIGHLCCPYCGCSKVKFCWGKIQTAFIPEKGGQFFGP